MLTGWLGTEVVHLTYKAKLVHVPRMFEEDPLPVYLFVYAYEDVVYCNQLYRVQRAALETRGLTALATTLSDGRAPPRALPPAHSACMRPTSLAVALVDGSKIVCLRNRVSGRLSLPLGPIPLHKGYPTHVDFKRHAAALWARVVGPPPKGVAAAINARLQKPMRLAGVSPSGDCVLFVAAIADCVAQLEILATAALGQSPQADLVLRDRWDFNSPASGCEPGQETLFQHLHCAALLEVR